MVSLIMVSYLNIFTIVRSFVCFLEMIKCYNLYTWTSMHVTVIQFLIEGNVEGHTLRLTVALTILSLTPL